MPGTDLEQRNPAQQLIATVRKDDFKEQVALALPENVKPERFVRAAVTALLQNPDIAAKADHSSIISSLLRAAQDGLVLDNKEAALVLFGNKAQYMPMIAGFRKIAAEHGWVIRSAVVHKNDYFEYELGLDTSLIHRPARPGVDRGPLIAAYAVGVNRDGQREFEVMYEPDIAKVRDVSRSKDRGPWKDWPERMWEKTVARRLFAKLPLDRSDARVSRLLASEDTPAHAVDALYGPGGAKFVATALEAPADHPQDGDEPPAAATPPEAPRTDGGEPQQAAASSARSEEAAVPGADDEPEPQPAWFAAGQTVVEKGAWEGKTIAEVAAVDAGLEWIGWALPRPGNFKGDFHQQLETYVAGALPELWAAHAEKSAA